MTGGSVVAEESNDGETYIIAVAGASASKIVISGNSVVSGPQAVSAPQSETAITGGTFAGTVEAKAGSITGGTFDREIPLTALEPGHISVKNENGTYSVSAESYAAVIGETGYATLTEAVVTAVSGDTVTLLQNTVIDDTVVVSGKTITLDMNGKTLSNTTDLWDDASRAWSLISVRENGDLTITGNGKFQTKENDCYALDTRAETAKLTIEDGTFVGNISAVYVRSGEVNIKGGTYSIQQLNANGVQDGYGVMINCYDADYKAGTAKVTITGGTFTKFNPADNKAEGDGTSFCPEGYGVSKNGDNYVPVSIAKATVQVLDGDGEVKYYYISTSASSNTAFTTAVAAAEDGETVKLLRNFNTSSLKAGLTYDLNGHTLTCTKTRAIEYSSKVMSFIDSSVTGSERGGTLKFTKLRGATTAAIKAQAGATLNLKNINFVSNASGLFPAENATALNIENCDVSSSVFCVGTNAATLENYGVIITMKDSIFTSTASDGDNTPVYINVQGTLNIDNCELTGGRQGLMVRAGTANIKNSTITTTGKYTNRDQYYASAWKEGNEVPAAALVVGNYAAGAATAYEANAVVTVENTKLTGENGFPALYVDGNTTYTSSVTLGGENTYVSGKIMKGQQTAEGKVLLTVTGGLFSDPQRLCPRHSPC